MVFIYNILIRLLYAGIYLASFFNEKAKKWISGRRAVFKLLSAATWKDCIWMHCASLGEFEQGRPVLESLRKKYPGKKILLTFYSPSGYEVRKNYAGADSVVYLPVDTRSNAKRFLDIVQPQLAIFVKYELWHHYLAQLQKRKTPTLLISALFDDNSFFFSWKGIFHRRMLRFFDHIFVQNANSLKNLSTIFPAECVTVAGDTRFDRVAEIVASFQPIEIVEKFTAGKTILVAGSTWPDDERNLKHLLEQEPRLSLIIAPHEVHGEHIQTLQQLFPKHVLFSKLVACGDSFVQSAPDVLIIDNIGMLSKLYHYGVINYIGGGFNASGIHNTLEASVYGKPVIFGPNYKTFNEAIGLLECNGARTYGCGEELCKIVSGWLNDPTLLHASGAAAARFTQENKGATGIIMRYITGIFS